MNRNLFYSLICAGLIVFLTLISAIPFGFTVRQQTAETVLESKMTPVLQEGKGYGQLSGPVVHVMTLENTFMPRQYVLPRAQACLYNSETQQGVYVNTRWKLSTLESKVSDFGENENVVQLGRETRVVELTVDQFARWERMPYPEPASRPVKAVPVVDYPQGFDTLYLWLIDKDGPKNFYPQCEAIQPGDLAYAKKIVVVKE